MELRSSGRGQSEDEDSLGRSVTVKEVINGGKRRLRYWDFVLKMTRPS